MSPTANNQASGQEDIEMQSQAAAPLSAPLAPLARSVPLAAPPTNSWWRRFRYCLREWCMNFGEASADLYFRSALPFIVAIVMHLLMFGFMIVGPVIEISLLLQDTSFDTESDRQLRLAVAVLCIVSCVASIPHCAASIYFAAPRDPVPENYYWYHVYNIFDDSVIFDALWPVELAPLYALYLAIGIVFTVAGKRWMPYFAHLEDTDNFNLATAFFAQGLVLVIWMGIALLKAVIRGCRNLYRVLRSI